MLLTDRVSGELVANEGDRPIGEARGLACGINSSFSKSNSLRSSSDAFSWLLRYFQLVLTLCSNKLELLCCLRSGGGVANEFEEITGVAAEISPRKDVLSGIVQINSEMQLLVQQEYPLVLIGKSVSRALAAFFVLKQLRLALLVCALDNKLVLEVLTRTPDEGGRVLEDELAVAFG